MSELTADAVTRQAEQQLRAIEMRASFQARDCVADRAQTKTTTMQNLVALAAQATDAWATGRAGLQLGLQGNADAQLELNAAYRVTVELIAHHLVEVARRP